MIKLFSLNHTEAEASISAQDKTQIRRVTVSIFLPKHRSQRPHELLDQLFKEREPLSSIEARILQPSPILSTADFETGKNQPNHAVNHLPRQAVPPVAPKEMRILQTPWQVSTGANNYFLKFRDVAFRRLKTDLDRAGGTGRL